MAKETQKAAPEAPAAKTPLTDNAFGIGRNSKGQYFLVSIKYNVDSKQAEIVEMLEQPNRGEAFERFKIKVATSDIMGG